MDIFYSPSINAFFDSSINELPSDAIPITDALHVDLLAAQSTGKVIMAGSDGKPIAVFPSTLLTLDQVKSNRIASLTAACASAIVGGYTSTALGGNYTYPSGMTDQINMMGSVTASLLPNLPSDWSTPFWCANSTGTWAYVVHNKSQIQQAGSDGKAHVIGCQTTLTTLMAQVASAKNAAAVEAIIWPTNNPTP